LKLNVQGIEEIEITDPAGLCKPAPAPPGMPVQQQPGSMMPQAPMPAIPGGLVNPGIRPIPGGFGDPALPRPSIYTRQIGDPTKWGVGGEAIQRAGQQVDPDKFEKNWQAKMIGEGSNGDGKPSNL